MHKFIQKLTSLGLTTSLSGTEKKRVRLLNILSINWLIIELVFMMEDAKNLENPKWSLLMHSGIILSILGCFLLQANKKYLAARILFFTAILTGIFLFANFIEPGVLIECFFLVAPPFMLLFTNRYLLLYPVFIVSFLLFSVPNEFFHHYPEKMFDSKILLLALFFMVFLLFDYFRRANVRSEGELENQRQELEKLNALQSRFFTNVAHEIRTPMTLIKGSMEQLKEHHSKNDPALTKIEKRLNTQIDKIDQMVDDVLDLTRMREASFELDFKETHFNGLIAKLVSSFEPLFRLKEIVFSFSEPAKQYYLASNPVYLERALNNLMVNAHKYTPKGGSVTLNLRLLDKTLSFEIKDTGIGISPKDLDKIGDRFYQVDNHINKAGGSGVGLAFAREIIAQHHGKLVIDSQPGKGSTFKVLLPLLAIKGEVPVSFGNVQKEVEEELPPIVINESLYTLLIVDDTVEMRAYLRSILSAYNCLEAENGLEALKIVESTTIDFVLTDYMMPEMDGYELIREIKARKYDFPILMLTARSDYESRLKNLRLGINDYLSKPFEKEELRIRIKNALNTQRIKNEYRNQVEELPAVEPTWIDQICEYVKNESGKTQFTQEDLATQFNLSKSTLYRKIKGKTGLTPNQYITEVKLQKARQILEEEPDLSVKRLALEVGYTHSFYFSKLFFNRFGIKPSEGSSAAD